MIRKPAPQPERTETEQEIWSGTQSQASLYSSLSMTGIFAVIVLIVLLLIPPVRGSSITWIIYLVGLVGCALIQLGIFAYQRLNRWYVVTTERIIHREGILVRRHYILELIRVDDVTFEQGPIEAIFGCGSVFVETSDSSHPVLELQGIEPVKKVSELIDGARREERKKRGFHVEQI